MQDMRSLIKQIVNELYITQVAQCYGDQGIGALKHLLDALNSIFRHITPEQISGKFVLVRAIDIAYRVPAAGSPISITNFALLSGELPLDQPCLLQLMPGGEIHLYKSVAVDETAISANAIVYIYQSRTDSFVLKGNIKQVPKGSIATASVFGVPCFSELREALEHYKLKFVQLSQCPILNKMWKDANRVFSNPKPEVLMRESLSHFLRVSVRDGEVRPEQCMDESHPVDIKVTWDFSNAIAIIEIKWLGKSVDANGRITAEFTDARARDGAKQLAEYLEMNKRAAPGNVSRGYLVVFDARRYAADISSGQIEKAKGYHYQHKEIDYQSIYDGRTDFEQPIRMFMEPVCQ